MQRTIMKETFLKGIGLHSGREVNLCFKPADINHGIVFKRVDVAEACEISIKDFKFGTHQRRTTVSKDGIEIQMVEHLMAVLWALNITNIVVEVDGIEMPGCDGSAGDYYECLKAAGVKEQDACGKTFRVEKPVWCEAKDAFLGIFPSDHFKISYILESPSPSIARQFLSLDLDSEKFFKEICYARTFCLREEAEMLLKMGLGKGANTNNTLVMDKNGPIDNVLRFPDEPVRHKVLDLIGDLYLTGLPVIGRVIALRSGHELNMKLVEQLRAQTKEA